MSNIIQFPRKLLDLKIGKRYRKAKFDIENFCSDDIVLICGKVDPSTVEYSRGARYFSDTGECYYPNGKIDGIRGVLHLEELEEEIDFGNQLAEEDLYEESSPEDLSEFSNRFARINPALCYNDKKFLRFDDLNFSMQLFSMYIDRFGIIRFIDKVVEFHKFNDSRYFSGKQGYEKNGQEREDGKPSMSDIIYMIQY